MSILSGLQVEIHQEGDGSYYAKVVNLPGCFTMAETLPEMQTNLKEAIASYIKSLQKDLTKYHFSISADQILHHT